MGLDIAVSKNGVPIRLTSERWVHIVENHDDLAGYYDEVLGTVENPDWILRGYGGAMIAVKGMGPRRYLATVYRELSPQDGFVVTAYFTSKINRRAAIWPARR
jgi:hypothetical protein